MLHIELDEARRAELQALRRTDLAAVSRDRLEMVLLSAQGWSAPRIAAHLGRHPHTVRAVLRDFPRLGPEAFFPDKPGPDPDHARREHVTGLLRELLGQERTWTAPQLAEALRPQGVNLSARQLRRYLRLLKAGYRRTASTLKHKQDQKKLERAEQVLANLKKKRRRAS